MIEGQKEAEGLTGCSAEPSAAMRKLVACAGRSRDSLRESIVHFLLN